MKKTHYEKLLEGPWPQAIIYKYLEKELPSADYTWDEFIKTGVMTQLASVCGESQEADLMAVAQMVFHTYSWYKGSGKIYEISDSIAEMLLNTHLDIDTSLVKSPCPEIIISLPDNLIKVRNNQTGWHWVTNIYVNFKEYGDYDKSIKILCVGKPNEVSVNEYDDALFYFRVNLKDKKVSQVLEAEIKGWKANPKSLLYMNEEDYEIMPRLFQLVLNVLLYITSADCDIKGYRSPHKEFQEKMKGLKNTAKIRKLAQKMDKESKLYRHVVGGSITLSKEEENLYSHGRLSVRFLVGGHWRSQWYGSKENQIQKPKWIRPYLKGPEISEMIKSIGVLK